MIAAHMPRVVKNSCGYRVEAVLDTDRGHRCRRRPSAETVRRRRGHAGPDHRSHAQPGAAARQARHRHGLLSVGLRRRAKRCPGILALKPTSCEIMDSSFLNFVRKSTTRRRRHAARRHRHRSAGRVRGRRRRRARRAVRRAGAATWPATPPSSLVRAMAAAETEQLWARPQGRRPARPELPGPKTMPSSSKTSPSIRRVPAYVSTSCGHPATSRRGRHHVRPRR